MVTVELVVGRGVGGAGLLQVLGVGLECALEVITLFLIVGEPVLTPSVVTILIGQSASFFCSAIGNPLPQITWYRGTNQITAAMPRVTITGSTLTISGIVIEDRGLYTCRAVFPAGITEAQAFLNILSKPLHKGCHRYLVAAIYHSYNV